MFNISDHDHLGKIITYGAALGAKVLIVVLTEICEEHEQAFNWLNDITRPEYSFFVVKFELIQIDNSNPAPHFGIIVQPNEWARTVKDDSENNELTEHRLLQLEFWKSLKKYLNENNLHLRLQNPKPKPYRDILIGTPEAHILLRINIPENQLSCSLYIRKNKKLFEYLKRQQENIEKEIGQTIAWIDRDVHSRAEIFKQNNGKFNPFDIANFQWFYEKSSLFEKVFTNYIDIFKKADSK